MKKFILLISILLLNNISISQWIWQNPLPQGNDLKQLRFLNSLTGYAIGNSSTIIKTTDGGNNWFNIKTDTTFFQISSVYFIDTANWWTVGDGFNNVMKTTNAGKNWMSFSNLPYTLFSSSYFLNYNTGYVLSKFNLVLKTTNSGLNWELQPIESSYNLNSVYFTNVSTGYIAGDGGIILKTTNGGLNWFSLASRCTKNISSISFVDSQTGWALNSDSILCTTNGGTNWISNYPNLRFIIPYPPYNYYSLILKDFHFNNLQTGWVIANNSNYGKYYINKTSNGGINWSFLQVDEYINTIAYINSLTGFVAGNNGIIKKTSNSGANWTSINKGTLKPLNSVFFINSQTGWIAGDEGLILKTTNGGGIWDSISPLPINVLNGIYFVNSQTGWTVGGSVGANGWAIYKSTNGGYNWILQLNVTYPANGLYSVYFLDSLTGFTVGSGGLILKTTNGGTNWNYYSGMNNGYDIVQFINYQTGWIFGGGQLLKTTNGGDNWFLLSNISGCSYGWFIDALTGWAGGLNNILKTTNGGLNWNIQLSLPSGNDWFLTVKFINNSLGFATCNTGLIFKTTNGGQNWSMLRKFHNWLYSIYFVDTLTGWIVGTNGTILKTTNGGNSVHIINNAKKNSDDFSLYQNYPNPFNPSTNIRYQIKKSGNVVIKIFDILGKVIETLVNEYQKEGTYEIQFSNSNLSSGIYFYGIETADFVQTKKMVLIK